MSSKFVSAGTDQAPTPKNVDWEKARQEIEKNRNVKPIEPGHQEGGKSLYEVLQANKAAKQEQFEEAAKVRNQFRALDDSEVEFLDSIRESERVKENLLKQTTAEQLDLFRKQKMAAEQAAAELGETLNTAEDRPIKGSWTTSRKRRRDKAETDSQSNKLTKPSNHDAVQPLKPNTSDGVMLKAAVLESRAMEEGESINTHHEAQQSKNSEPRGLGLGAYDSDD